MPPSPVFVAAEVVTDLVDHQSATSALRETYTAQPPGARNAGRVVARGMDGSRIRALTAVPPAADLLGAKLHVQLADGGSSFLIALFSRFDGQLMGLVDGRPVTELRTAATSTLALGVMAPPGPLRLGLLGSGAEARCHLRAVAAVSELERAHVFSPTRAHRERFAAEMAAQLSLPVRACGSAEEAVCSSSTVIAAARSRGEVPIFDPDALRPGTLVISIGSTVPQQRELDARVLERAALIITDEPAELLSQTGDCIAARDAGIELAAKTFSLAELLQGTLPARLDQMAIRVFKSVGSALQDVSVAGLALRLARESGRGTPLPIELSGRARRD